MVSSKTLRKSSSHLRQQNIRPLCCQENFFRRTIRGGSDKDNEIDIDSQIAAAQKYYRLQRVFS